MTLRGNGGVSASGVDNTTLTGIETEATRYDNNMHRGESHITQIDPTMVAKRVIRGKEFDLAVPIWASLTSTLPEASLSRVVSRGVEVSKAYEMTLILLIDNNSGEVYWLLALNFSPKTFVKVFFGV